MKETLRILWLVFAFVVLLPVIIAVEMWWLFICIKSSKSLGHSVAWGLMRWIEWIKRGVEMNADFVKNGL